MPDELTATGEDKMKTPIKIDLRKQVNRLDPKARINLKARHCVQQNWRIYKIGRVAEESWPTLLIEHMLAIQDLSWDRLLVNHMQAQQHARQKAIAEEEEEEEEAKEELVEERRRRQTRRRSSAAHAPYEREW